MTGGGLYIGAMTGTSVDGLDLALIEDTSRPRILAGQTVPIPPPLRHNLLQLVHNDEAVSLDLLGQSDTALGRCIGSAILEFLSELSVAPQDVLAIGSHGQTVRHRPDHPFAFTTQIGDPHQIAEITGITTVADFRRRDMAAGGQGAPLVPSFHRALFETRDETRVVLNIGGIANITVLTPGVPLSGFDTGPGNGLLDLWISTCLGKPMDADGAWAAEGKADPDLLAAALSDPYFTKPPPKSTGREYFSREWLQDLIRTTGNHLRPVEIQATLLELTARSVSTSLSEYVGRIDRVIVCGGGRRNVQLMAVLRRAVDAPVESSEQLGVDGDSLEAAAFAWLAARAIGGEPMGQPGVTGARGPRILGVIFPR